VKELHKSAFIITQIGIIAAQRPTYSQRLLWTIRIVRVVNARATLGVLRPAIGWIVRLAGDVRAAGWSVIAAACRYVL